MGRAWGDLSARSPLPKAELWKVGQVKPGDTIRFYPISVADAVAREKAMDRTIDTLQSSHLTTFAVPSLAARDGVSAAALVLACQRDKPAIAIASGG
jgi:Allophanate hydrolase subunit 2